MSPGLHPQSIQGKLQLRWLASKGTSVAFFALHADSTTVVAGSS